MQEEAPHDYTIARLAAIDRLSLGVILTFSFTSFVGILIIFFTIFVRVQFTVMTIIIN